MGKERLPEENARDLRGFARAIQDDFPPQKTPQLPIIFPEQLESKIEPPTVNANVPPVGDEKRYSEKGTLYERRERTRD